MLAKVPRGVMGAKVLFGSFLLTLAPVKARSSSSAASTANGLLKRLSVCAFGYWP